MTDNDLIQATKPKPMRQTKKVPTMQIIIADSQAGKSIKQMAAAYGCTEQAIRSKCKKHGFSSVQLRSFKERRADIFAWKQSQLIEAMSKEKISGASLRDQATTFNILHNAERLERGQSTQNLDFNSLGAALSELEVEEARLKAELARLGAGAEVVTP